jgi:uncharacterized protein YbjQ (UPF0145 family)
MMAGRAFTSDLSGQEFWLVVDKGYLPLGMVLGNCVYAMGAFRGWLANLKGAFRGEVGDVSRLMYDARELALARMQAEADALGADGVVGVDLKIDYLHGGEWMEVTAIGTAIKYVGAQAGDTRDSQAQVVLDVSENRLRRPQNYRE